MRRPPPPPESANWRLVANYGMHRHRPWQTCPKQIGALLGGEEAFRSSLAPAYSAATRRRRGASATIQHTKPMQAPLAALQPAIASRLTYGPLESSMQHLCSSHRLRLSAAEQQRRRPPGPPPGYPAAAALVPPELVRSRCTSQSFRTPVRRSKRPGREFVLARALALALQRARMPQKNSATFQINGPESDWPAGANSTWFSRAVLSPPPLGGTGRELRGREPR